MGREEKKTNQQQPNQQQDKNKITKRKEEKSEEFRKESKCNFRERERGGKEEEDKNFKSLQIPSRSQMRP